MEKIHPLGEHNSENHTETRHSSVGCGSPDPDGTFSIAEVKRMVKGRRSVRSSSSAHQFDAPRRSTASRPRIRRIRRRSTASAIHAPMWLLPATKLFALFGRGDSGQSSVLDSHQYLKARGDLVKWGDVKGETACIIFVSHEWVSWEHADPGGEQLRVLCRMLHRLASGQVKHVEMELFAQVN